MELDQNFWLLFIANLPVVTVFFVALQKRAVVMGRTHTDALAAKDEVIKEKDEEIAFREKLRQEALADLAALKLQNEKSIEATRELTNVVKQSLELNEHLVEKDLEQRWDGNDRRTPKASTGPRRSA